MNREFRRESEMEQPVWKWLEKCGYIVHRQSTLLSGGIPDLLGYSVIEDTFAAVELKLDRYTIAKEQAECYRCYCQLSYVAFPSQRAERIFNRHRDHLAGSGIGLLSVKSDSVKILLPANYNRQADFKGLYKRFKREIKKVKGGD